MNFKKTLPQKGVTKETLQTLSPVFQGEILLKNQHYEQAVEKYREALEYLTGLPLNECRRNNKWREYMKTCYRNLLPLPKFHTTHSQLISYWKKERYWIQ